MPGGKGTLTNAGTRVPLIGSWPGHVPSGRVSHALIHFSDFLPTLAELAGAEMPQDRMIDGISFVPQLLGSEKPHRPWIYMRWQGEQWARDYDWKLYGDGALYHVAEDEAEQHPIPPGEGEAEAAEARAKLRQAFDKLGVETE